MSPVSARTRALLEGPIAPTLLRMALPNVLVMVAQAGAGLIETWFVGQLGTDALAGVALVFPVLMMMQMMSAGAMGGGIASAIARALGGRRKADADALAVHAGWPGRCWATSRASLLPAGGGWLVLRSGGGIASVFWAQAVALVLYGLINGMAVAGGAWFGPVGRPRRPGWWASEAS